MVGFDPLSAEPHEDKVNAGFMSHSWKPICDYLHQRAGDKGGWVGEGRSLAC